MRLFVVACLTAVAAFSAVHADAQESISALDLARHVRDKGVQAIPIDHYTGVLLMQGAAETAATSGDEEDLRVARELLLPYATGEKSMGGNFVSYRCGGNGSAFLLERGLLPEGRDAVLAAARATCDSSPRSSDGIVQASGNRSHDRVFMDTAFPVTPFLLSAARSLEEDDSPALRSKFIDLAWRQTLLLHEVLWNEETELYHQGRGFQGDGVVSTDHWSRGNGWAALAWAAIVRDLPREHPDREEAEKLFRRFMQSVVAHQDDDGMWRQEMTRFDDRSYPETSGAGLLLYAMAVGIESGVLDDSYREPFRRGLSAYVGYIDSDGSVRNTCVGTLCPGDGTPEAYCRRPWKKNDPHAFGPAVLALSAAHRIGVKTVDWPVARPSDQP